MMNRLVSNSINLLLYQGGWFACVLGGAWGYPVIGALLAAALVGVHLLLVPDARREGPLLAVACLIGVVVDSLQQALGLFTFQADPGWPFWLPLWVFVIWAQFATLFHYALRWLRGRYWLAALFGLLGGPLAYWAGVRLGAASFGSHLLLSLLVLAVVWAVVTPLLVRLSESFDAGDGHYRRPW
ncbi:MAG: DUF2878 domain-containing protein [Desulfuromonadales bacterium]